MDLDKLVRIGGAAEQASGQDSIGNTTAAGQRLTARLQAVVWVSVAGFVAWRLSGVGGPNVQPAVVDAAFVLPGPFAGTFAWSAARRCRERRTRSAWLWITVSLVLLTVTFACDLGYQLARGAVPFPSVADACYFAFNGAFLIGLLRFPTRPESREGKLRLWVDVAIVGLAGASVIWLLVLGPTVMASGQTLLEGAVAGAYPVSDLVSIFVLAYVISRGGSPSTQRALRLLVASTAIAIIGDLSNGWMALHPHYHLQEAVDIAFAAGWAFLVLAGPAQAAVARAEQDDITPMAAGRRVGWTGRGAWLPYIAPAVVLALLVYSQFDRSFTDRLTTAIAAVLVSMLVLLRQFLSRRDLVAAQGELSYRALHDTLTGLPNRLLVLDRTERMLAAARRHGTVLAVLFVDIDGFKHVNDTLGHSTGDQLLRAIAQRLSSAVRESDTVGRLAGDEFVVLLDTARPDGDAEIVAARLLDAVREPVEFAHGRVWPLSVTASIGIASGDSETPEQLLHCADLALYAAKDTGKNRYARFDGAMKAAAQQRLTTELDLRAAINSDQLLLAYQPIFDLRSGEIPAVEALVRWRHPTRGVVPPGEFIPIAEETGMIVDIGQWVLHHACRQAAAWRRQGYRIGITVNISGRQLDDDQLLDDVRDALANSQLKPETVTLEITETAIMKDPYASARRLLALKSLGVRIAIDDFGTGYSSLAYLHRFPVDLLKIDRSFISALGASTEAAALVHTLVQLGNSLSLQTVAEGIEHPSQLEFLTTEGCDLAQGFLLARPLDAQAVRALLADSHTTPDRGGSRTVTRTGSAEAGPVS